MKIQSNFIADYSIAEMKPVLVVGAGLSAADAVSICRSSGINVIHVYRNRSAGLDKMLPETVYPEYHEVSVCRWHCHVSLRPQKMIHAKSVFRISLEHFQVHKMMKDSVNTYSLYSPMPEHTIIEFIPGELASNDSLSTPCHQVVLKQLNTGDIKIVDVSYCAILIGFRPDLQFLEPNLQRQQQCGDNSTAKTLTEQEILCNNDTNHIVNTNTKDSQLISMPYALLSRKIAWLKNLCAKCKHLSICDRNNKQNLVNRQAVLNRTLTTLCSCTNDLEIIPPANHNHHHHCCKHPNNKNSNDNNNNIRSMNCDTYHLFESKDGQQQQPHQQQQSDKKTNASVVVAEPKSVNPPTPMGLGEDPTKPIDCKSNPIAVDKYSNEVLNAPTPGLFAMGPLVGDNFIRFIPGGALSITSALWKQR